MTRPLALEVHGAGRPVLLVHGFPFHRGMWSAQFAALAPHGRILAPDLLGFGASSYAPQDTPLSLTMDTQADALAATLDEQGVREPVVLIGFSMGGYVGWSFLRRYRERVAALVLHNTRAAADTAEGARGRMDMADRVTAEGHKWLIDGMLPKLVAPRTLKERPAVCEAVSELMQAAPLEAVAAAQRGMAQRPDSTELARTLDLPTLAIVGEHDAISKRDELEALTGLMPRAKFVEIADAGHMTVLEQPQATNLALVDFLKSLR